MINDSETRSCRTSTTCCAPRGIFSSWVRKRWSSSAANTARMMVHQNRMFRVPAFPLEEVHDPTGAGDSFAGGFMGYLASARAQ